MKLLFVIAFTALLFASCHFDDNELGNKPNHIVFDNRSNQFRVEVYTSPERLPYQMLASVEERQQSGEVEFLLQPQGFYFYPRYYFIVENIVFFYDDKGFQYIIPDIGTATICIPPLLESVDPNKPLVSAIYLSIRNSGTSLLRLASNNAIILPKGGEEGVNPGTAAMFNDAAISPGSADRYRLMAGGGSVPFPPDLTFSSGHIYFLEYNDSTISLERAPVPVNLNSVGQWQSGVSVPGPNLTAKLAWFSANAQSGNSYIIEVTQNESIAPHIFNINGRNNITLTLKGNGTQRTIMPNANGSLFTLGAGLSLIIDENITLQGRSSNNAPLVEVSEGAAFTLNQGAIISGNINSNGLGGGACLASGGTFTMNGGIISGNTAKEGGGVYVGPRATLTMHGGMISGNTAKVDGGGVFNSGRLRISGGTIHGDDEPEPLANSAGGYGWASLYNDNGITGQYGVFNTVGSFTQNGNLVTTNVTIHVENGLLHQSATIIYQYNGGSGILPVTQTVVVGSSVTLPDGSGLYRDRYSFGGWNTKADGSGDTYHAGTVYALNANTALYAHWILDLTGTVSISGNAWVGQTLSVDTRLLYGSGDIFYQWMRGSTSIAEANDRTYIVQDNDVGYTITVLVTRANNSGNVTSRPTALVPVPLTGALGVNGDAVVGHTLTANIDLLSGSGIISYQWKRGNENVGTNSRTYLVQDTDIGSTITVTV
ncbi:MAG: InlB B-repeat-containing protein, partial [Treponema sp.]|nr:InlB B-repeat-containing protein [Treponema sp.]